MSQIDVNSLLAQMRSLSSQMDLPSATSRATESTGASDFGAMLRESINKVSESQDKAGAMSTAFERGDPNVDLPQMMIQMQKADLSFKAMTEVRNKLVDAYKEIMNMPV